MPRLDGQRLVDFDVTPPQPLTATMTAGSTANMPYAGDVPNVESMKVGEGYNHRSTRVQELVAQPFTVAHTVDSMTDLVDVLPTAEEKPQAETPPTEDIFAPPLPAEITLADDLHAGMSSWPSSRPMQEEIAAQPDALDATESDFSTRPKAFDLHLKESQPQGNVSPTSLADHIASDANPSLSGLRSEAKMPFRALKATDAMDAYERLAE